MKFLFFLSAIFLLRSIFKCISLQSLLGFLGLRRVMEIMISIMVKLIL